MGPHISGITDVNELIERSYVVSIPLRIPFRGLTHREVMLIDGPEGPGEWAAFTEYPDDVAAKWLATALEQAFDDTVTPAPAGVEKVAVNATFPALDPGDVAAWWKKFPGAKAAKVKVGEPGQLLIDDVARVNAIRQAVGPDVTLRLDANARWSVSEADKALFMLRAFNIDYVEQPVSAVDEMVYLKRQLRGTGIRLAADELIRQSGALDEVIDKRAADIAVLKVSPLGGIRPTLALAQRAHDAGLQVVISSGLETSVGLSWGARAAAIVGDQAQDPLAAGLGTAVFLESDVVTQPLKVTAGSIPVNRPVLDPRKIRKVIASAERTTWWQERLRRCLPLVAAGLES